MKYRKRYVKRRVRRVKRFRRRRFRKGGKYDGVQKQKVVLTTYVNHDAVTGHADCTI